MIQINIAEAKARLSEYLERVQGGETVMICKGNVPIAELRPLAGRTATPRRFGGYKGKITIRPEFFDSLQDDEIALWEGREAPGR